jgi:hypothetical protein
MKMTMTHHQMTTAMMTQTYVQTRAVRAVALLNCCAQLSGHASKLFLSLAAALCGGFCISWFPAQAALV